MITDTDYVKVSFGNKKLPKSTLIFNLPAVITCPLRTKFCEVNCYALKAERQYKHVVLQARQWNLDKVQQGQFKRLMIEVIETRYDKIKQVRIHESGDFYNQAYLNDWFEVAREFPKLTFYAYTKSFQLNFSKKPANFVLIASLDDTTNFRRIKLYNEQKECFDNAFIVVDRHAEADCIGDCSKCSRCWTQKGQTITVNHH